MRKTLLSLLITTAFVSPTFSASTSELTEESSATKTTRTETVVARCLEDKVKPIIFEKLSPEEQKLLLDIHARKATTPGTLEEFTKKLTSLLYAANFPVTFDWQGKYDMLMTTRLKYIDHERALADTINTLAEWTCRFDDYLRIQAWPRYH